MADRKLPKKPAAGSMPDASDIPPVGAGVAPVAGHDERSPDVDTGEGAPERKRKFQKRLAEKVDQSLKEHPDGSAPPLDRLTQDLDPSTDL
jgi:hypothetical protein